MMRAQTAIEAAGSGDRTAFAELVRRYQDMAFGYALSILGDYHAAEDATQEAFGAYFGLAALREPAAFPGWLRTIVRHQCYRLTRGHRATTVPLEVALGLASAEAGPAEQAERAEVRADVLGALMALPPPLREIVTLYYIGDSSQREIAAFLDLPVTTVNNRLHAARRRLRGGLLPMVKDNLPHHTLPEDFADRVGKIIAIRGPVVDVQFAPGQTPDLLDALTLEETATLAVMQQVAEGRVRCIALNTPSELREGMGLTATGGPVQQAVSPDILREAAAILIRPAGSSAMIETGIKAIDLLAPLPAVGAFALYGPPGAGKLVVLGEIVRRLEGQQEITLLNFVQAGVPSVVQFSGGERVPRAGGAIETFYLPAADAADPSSQAVEAIRDDLQGAVYLSHAMALQGLYPACDPAASWSRLLREEIVGREPMEVAARVRALLGRTEEAPANDQSTEDDEITAERLRAYLTQPFFIGEPFTGIPGVSVPVSRTVHDCAQILAGRYNDVPTEELRFIGSLDRITG